MKLVSLESDRSSFRTLKFNPEGLSLIVGDAAEKEGSANGVGKTLALKLIHLCLGANKDRFLAEKLPDWRFRLTFELGGGSAHVVERMGDGRDIKLDGRSIGLSAYKEWLTTNGPFDIGDRNGSLSFRTLYGRFARLRRKDREDPVRLDREQEHDALLRTFFLLGADINLINRKVEHRTRQLELKDQLKFLKAGDPRLQEMMRAGVDPRVQLHDLKRKIDEIDKRRAAMKVAEDYDGIRRQADELTNERREIEKQIAVLDFHLQGIEKALQEKPDVQREVMLSFYEGLQRVFRDDALRRFEDVETFHQQLASKRRQRLQRDSLEMKTEKSRLEQRLEEVGAKRDEALQYLAKNAALDEYTSVVQKLESLKQDRKRLEEYLSIDRKLQEQLIEVKQAMAEGDRAAADYVETNPLDWADEIFRATVQDLYPKEAAGIVIENNTGDNKLRYNLKVQIQSQESDGINAARVLCFDWLIFLHGAHHDMGHLWHDNGLFDHVDPNQRSRWFELVSKDLASCRKQYIVSINTENFESMLANLLDDKLRDELNSAVIARLKGNQPANKLLGIQVG